MKDDTTHLPERCALLAIRVESVNAVVFRGHEHYIVGNASDADVANVQGLCVYVAVEVVSEQLAELGGIDVSWRQYGLVRIETRARIVVVIGEHSQKTGAFGCGSRVVLDSNAARLRRQAAQVAEPRRG